MAVVGRCLPQAAAVLSCKLKQGLRQSFGHSPRLTQSAGVCDHTVPHSTRQSEAHIEGDAITTATRASKRTTPLHRSDATCVTHDVAFMSLALQQAQLAFAAREVPVGAVLVSAAGEVLAAAHNQAEGSHDPTAHAELLCIRQAASRLGAWRLLDATLYVTLEPCPMCAGALLQSRVGTLVYGARNNLLGADGSWIAMLPCAAGTEQEHVAGSISDSSTGSSADGGTAEGDVDSSMEGRAPAMRPLRPHPFHPDMAVRRGVLAAECGSLMKQFFAKRRRESAKKVVQTSHAAQG